MDDATKSGAGRLALVVEDLPDELQLVANALRDAGYEVVTAENADAARQTLRALPRRPDVAVLDWNFPAAPGALPDELGESMAHEVRAAFPAVPILFRTSLLDETGPERLKVQRVIEHLSHSGPASGIGKGLDAPSSDIIADDVSKQRGYASRHAIPWDKLNAPACDVLGHAMHDALDHERAKRLLTAVDALIPQASATVEDTLASRPLTLPAHAG